MAPTTIGISAQRNSQAFTLLHIYLSRPRANWSVVETYLRNHPEEAASRSEYGASALYKCLSRRVDDYPPASFVQLLLESYPPAAWEANADKCPLKMACWRRAPLPILKMLLESRPSRDQDVEALRALWTSYARLLGGRSELIAHILEGGREGAEIWQKLHLLLHYCTSSQQSMAQWRGLHAAVLTPECPLGLLQLSFHLFPDQVRLVTDCKGRLPLHLLLTISPEKVSGLEAKVDALIEWYPDALHVRDRDGMLPLHIASQRGHKWPVLERLLKASPDALSRQNGVDRLHPFQLAAAADSDVNEIFQLLRASPDQVQSAAMKASACRSRQNGFSGESILQCVLLRESDFRTETVLQEVGSSNDPNLWTELRLLLQCRQDEREWRPVHAVASLLSSPRGLLETAITICPHELFERRGVDGQLPLHMACQHRQTDHGLSGDEHDDSHEEEQDADTLTSRIALLLNACPSAASVADNKGRLPLHLAIDAGQEWVTLQLLLQAAPNALHERISSFYPFQMVALAPLENLTEVYGLLLAAPDLVKPSAPHARSHEGYHGAITTQP